MKKYDNVCKFLVEKFTDDFSQWLLGETYQFSELEPTEFTPQPIQADALILLQSKQLVLHIEFQTRPDPKISSRMLDYFIRIHQRFPKKEIRQFVLYLKKTNSKLVQQTSFQFQKTSHHFDVIRLWEYPPDNFLSKLGLLPFAVLSQTDNPSQVLREVSQKIESIEEFSQKAQIASVSALLAGLVLNPSQIKKLIRSEIMKESTMYQAILEEGKLEGKLEGLLEGKQEIARNLLRHGLSFDEILEVTGLTPSVLKKIVDSLNQNN